jgi:hypothetical protein
MLSFIALVLTTTPLAENKIVGVFGLSKGSPSRDIALGDPKQSQQAKGPQTRTIALGNPNLSCLSRCCGLIHSFAGFHDTGNTTAAAIQRLMEMKKASPGPIQRPPDVNEPKPQPTKKDTATRPSRRLDEDVQQ